MFADVFATTLTAMLQIALIAIAAAVLLRKHIVTDSHVTAMTAIMINVLLPCMVFANLIRRFDPGQFAHWPVMPLISVLLILTGLALAAVLFYRDLDEKRNMLAPASIQNAGYLILPLGQMLYPEQFDEFAMYTFLLVLGVNPMLWSMGKFLVSAGHGEKVSIKRMLTPPFVASVGTLIIILLGLHKMLPPGLLNAIITPVEMLGSATPPLSMFALGAMLATASWDFRAYWKDAYRILVVKFIFLPMVMIGVLYYLKIHDSHPLLASMLVMQAASAPAVGLMMQVKHYGGNVKKISSIVLLC
ncbi:MAG: hypothetical protein B6I25_08635 [Planctomycetales bacterium 4572_13]|nr:MAG: hypothetical protein B6I25_08635 [Planctomycetales bacterium 4572_13]